MNRDVRHVNALHCRRHGAESAGRMRAGRRRGGAGEGRGAFGVRSRTPSSPSRAAPTERCPPNGGRPMKPFRWLPGLSAQGENVRHGSEIGDYYQFPAQVLRR